MNSHLMAQILTSIGDGVIAVDTAEKIIYMNEAAAQITGWDSTRACGLPFDTVFNLFNAQTGEPLTSPVAWVLQTGTPTGLQNQSVVITKDGATKYLSATCTPIQHPGEDVSGVVVVFRDITRYKSLERKAENEENNLRALFNSAPVGMYIVDEAKIITHINDAALKLFGSDRSQVIGYSFGNALSCLRILEDQRGCGHSASCQYCEFQRAVSLAFEGSAVSGIECSKTIVHDGKEVLYWFRASASPIVADGKTYVMVALADITDQKRKEISISKTRDFYLRIFESFPTIIWRSNIAGNTESINENWQTLTGQPVDQALGYGWIERVYPDDRQKCFCPGRRHQSEGELAEAEIRVLDRNGQYRWLYCVHRLYYDMDGNAEGYISMGIDITARKFAEEELKEARDKAEAVNKAKSEFLANMSHEIRTPINGIMGMIDLTLLTELNSEQKENLVTAKSCARSLLGIINDILDFSKMEAGKLLLEYHNFKLKSLLDEVIKTYSLRAKKKGLELDYTFSTAVPDILTGDSHRLRQVLNNLIDNAVKFTEQGGVVLLVKASERERDSVQLTFIVRDTGIGIAPNEMDKLFKTFSQVDGSTTRRYGGTGLGLVISRQLVEMMGGTMWVESEKNQGSTFSFTIPFQIGTSVNENQHPRKVVAREMTSPLKLLLAEDDTINRIVIQRQIQQIGHQVETAENGVKALEMWRQKEYDAILMDIQMPEMDGLEVTKRIREDEAATGKHTLILALTAHALVGDRERFLAVGMDEYLAKPVPIDELSKKLELFSLQKRRGGNVATGHVKINESGEIVFGPTAESFQDSPAVFAEIETLAAGMNDEMAQDSAMIEGVAHRIKELANQVGLDELKSAAFKAELAIRRDNRAEALRYIGMIARICGTYKKAGLCSKGGCQDANTDSGR